MKICLFFPKPKQVPALGLALQRHDNVLDQIEGDGISQNKGLGMLVPISEKEI